MYFSAIRRDSGLRRFSRTENVPQLSCHALAAIRFKFVRFRYVLVRCGWSFCQGRDDCRKEQSESKGLGKHMVSGSRSVAAVFGVHATQ